MILLPMDFLQLLILPQALMQSQSTLQQDFFVYQMVLKLMLAL